MSDLSASLDSDWIPVPDVAERWGILGRTVRSMVRDGRLVAVHIEGLPGPRVPESFLDANGPIDGLTGTITQLRDAGLTDDELVIWLLTMNDELGDTPARALRFGKKHAVRRAAISLAF